MKSEKGKIESGPRREIVDRTFGFAVAVVRFCKGSGRAAGSAKALLNQLLRSGTSVGANVQEAQAAQSRKDFISKMRIALKEARESEYWLRLLVRAEVVSGEQASALIREAAELKCILGAIVVTAKRNLEPANHSP